jgi:hypothetical protein
MFFFIFFYHPGQGSPSVNMFGRCVIPQSQTLSWDDRKVTSVGESQTLYKYNLVFPGWKEIKNPRITTRVPILNFRLWVG